MKFTLLQKQALQTALVSVIVLGACAFLMYQIFGATPLSVILYLILLFLFIYLLYKYQIKKFMYLQFKRVYNTELFENEPFLKKDLDDFNLDTFIEKIKLFAQNKHDEIDKLHDRDDFRRDFLGDVSHELKTPLFTAQGYLLTVLDDSIEDPVLERKYLERTNKSIERLTYIIKDLDMIAKLESGMKLSQEPFNILKAINDVFEILEIKATKKNITLDFKEPYDIPILVRADREKIEQVLINLISNSINYGSISGSCLVSVNFHSTHQIMVSVIDDGVGIEEKNLPRLFERFYRIDKSRSREQGGSGLGLAIVKHIIEAHNQEIFVKSKLDQGSTFSFTLNKVL